MKKKLTCIDEIDNFLIDQLMEQICKGQKIGEIFTKTTYAIVTKEIGEIFHFHLNCKFEYIKKNITKTLKK